VDTTSRMFLYSAHDTTLVAVFQALGVLNKTSALVLPGYATSLVFELYEDQGIYSIHVKLGEPTLNGTEWGYELTDMAMMCPGPQLGCSFNDWAQFVNSLIVPGGCCKVTPLFNEYNCNNFSASSSTLAPPCQFYRRFCPVQSCDANQVLDTASQVCVPLTTTISNSENKELMYLGLGAGLTLISVLLGRGLWWLWQSGRKSTDYHTFPNQ